MNSDDSDACQRAFIDRCAAIVGAAAGDGAFSPGPALWVGRREVAHFDGPTTLEIRLTLAVIRARRRELADDPRIAFRRSTSDWIAFALEARGADDDDAFALVRAAVEANRPDAPPGPPPAGAELERRRRFH